MMWEESADVLDMILQGETDHDKVLAKIPGLFGLSGKATFLAYRAMGLNVEDTLVVMELDEDQLEYWRKSDEEFLQFEGSNLNRLQSTLGPELIRISFMRNMAMFVSQDSKILRKSLVYGLDSLDKREFDYTMKVRGSYTPGDLVAMNRAMGEDIGDAKVVINLTWGPGQQQSLEHIDGEYKLLGDPDAEDD